MRHRTAFPLVTAILLTMAAASERRGRVTDYDVPRHTLAPGGASASIGGDFEVVSAVGQVDATPALAGGAFELTGGVFFQIRETDCNADGAVTLADYAAFALCLRGPADSIVDLSCRCFDVDRDGAVDIRDFARLQSLFTGP